MPFRPPFDSYYEEIIKPAAKSAGLEVLKADEIYGTGPIVHDIWNQIWAASVVIADVTGKNPNVNYELGICHSLNIPTVIITQEISDVPFDYQHRRCIKYNTTEVNWQSKLKKAITATLKKVIAGEDAFPELPWPYDTSPHRQENNTSSLVPAADARDMVVRGALIVRDPIALAFGPRGAHISLSAGAHGQVYYRQGVMIARSLSSPRRLEQIGIGHAIALADDMRRKVGDGTKTAILIFQKLLEVGSNALKSGHSHTEILRGMARATEVVVAAVRAQSKQVRKTSLTQVARTATAGNLQVAHLIVEAFSRVGRDGIVVIQKAGSRESVLELQEGMTFDRGIIDQGFFQPGEVNKCVLEDAYVLTCEHTLSSMRDVLPLLEEVANAKRPLLLIVGNIEGEALATLIVNRKRGTLDCVAVRAPGYADSRRAILQDIAALTRGTVITLASGQTLATVSLRELGAAKKIIVTKDETTILGGAGEASVGEYLEAIREQLSRTSNSFESDKLRERMARLSGSIAAVRIGGESEQDITDNVYSAESAMYSVQTAIEEGVVAGGGVSLFRAREALKKLDLRKPGEIAGILAMTEAVEEPLRQLMVNSGADSDAMLRKLTRSRTAGTGFNAETGKLEILDEVGVLDPVATVTHAVQLAYSHVRPLLATAAWESATLKSDPSITNFSEPQVEATESDQPEGGPK